MYISLLLGACSTRVTSVEMSAGVTTLGKLSLLRSVNATLLAGVRGRDLKESPRINWVCGNLVGRGGNMGPSNDV